MEIKGVAVKSIPGYIKKKYPDQYSAWLNSLSHESRKIFIEGVISNLWYPIEDAAIEPTRKLGEILFNDPQKGAWESGKFSAEEALTGVYRIYVRMASPGHIISRASRIFQAYYHPANIHATNHKAKSVEVHITHFPTPNEVIEHRVGGWIEKALELSGCKEVKVDIDKSLTQGDKETIYSISWT